MGCNCRGMVAGRRLWKCSKALQGHGASLEKSHSEPSSVAGVDSFYLDSVRGAMEAAGRVRRQMMLETWKKELHHIKEVTHMMVAACLRHAERFKVVVEEER
jgi:uncharacterized alpha-E superfamily protein